MRKSSNLPAWFMMLVYAATVVMFFALTACSSGPTLQEMKDEAMITGDWSEVEKREKAIERRKASTVPCRGGIIKRVHQTKRGYLVYECL